MKYCILVEWEKQLKKTYIQKIDSETDLLKVYAPDFLAGRVISHGS